MISAFLIWLLCMSHDLHDVGTQRSGVCKRCHLDIDENGDAIVRPGGAR